MHRESTIRRTIALGILAAALPGAPLHAASCGAAAIEDGQAFTLRRVVADPVLHRSWAVYQNCAHPERPLEVRPVSTSSLAVSTAARPSVPSRPFTPTISPELSAAAAPKPLEVRAGDRVHLWSAGDHVRMEIEAVALEYGHTGQVIHLRRLALGATPGTMLAGIVDGPGSAELLP